MNVFIWVRKVKTHKQLFALIIIINELLTDYSNGKCDLNGSSLDSNKSIYPVSAKDGSGIDMLLTYLSTYISDNVNSPALLDHIFITSPENVAWLLNIRGHDNPIKSEQIKMLIRGISRIHGKPQKQAAPLLKEDLVVMLSQPPNTLKVMRDQALLIFY